METREGFGEHGNVAMFDDFPTVATVSETLEAQAGPSRQVVALVLDELAFCMKTATRLGRVVRIGERWWGHPQAYGSRQMEVVDEYERTGLEPEEFDLWAVLDPSDLIALVALRTGIVTGVVDAVVSEFCEQVESFRVQGIHFRTPPRSLGSTPQLLDELAAHVDVLAVHDRVLDDARRVRFTEGAPEDRSATSEHLVCRDRAGGWLAVELHPDVEDPLATTRLSTVLDTIRASHAADDEPVHGLVLSDGYSQLFVERVMRDERIVHLNLRTLDLPCCRAQRWAIKAGPRSVGWVAVAADGRTVVSGGGPAFPTLATLEPFEHVPLDWENQRLWPLPVGDRSTPGAG